MTKYIKTALLALISMIWVGCDKDEITDKVEKIKMYVSAETGTYIPWGSETPVECMLVKEEGELEYSHLAFGSIKGFDYVHGHEYELEVRKITLANPPADGSNITYTLLKIISDIPPITPKPEKLPEEAKFKLKMVQLTPFMNLDTPLAAPFDFLKFRILNYKDEYTFPVIPDFLKYYDLIEMSSPVLPDTYCVYRYSADENGTKRSYTSQWGSYFYEKIDFPICLKGYKDGELLYEYSTTQIMRERDFLGVDWKNGSVTLANPKTNCIYNILDTHYEFLLTDTQKLNKTCYIKIQVSNSSNITETEYLKEQEAGLKWLLKKYLGEKSSLTASDFKTLPEDTDIVETYENSTTLVAILHQNADDMHEECYYAIAESK
ncbi:DUF4377 domain-containing protein [Bacteroides pyogenes]|uniref:DUF4377 domain-containing protein n=2 Tax=Bacteroides pyogenes TaxID=310300 RepID=UPI0011E4586E|nr:DUF4377 domain-containing protein [Bacteroides pyogenes]MBR8709704.1 hypothetical protein [Bacteroides pyogenes]MBR8718606.1 hypothetical protein [Bacteroides pyogenes]MBR8748070.1 hypothetical protein [Bacteroides pyogenes]MBR8758362.1 hypothetical protein [Bacteroides pyogenes]MBR8781589.1 hypothetical protein [Bacteroides pyogenes]